MTQKTPQGSAKLYQTNAVLTASPGKLVQMLLDGTLRFVRSAAQGFNEPVLSKRNELVHNNIQRAQAIIAELQANLDMNVAGDFAPTMFKLYDFMYERLQESNLNKKPEPLADVEKILSELSQSWNQMLSQAEAPQAN